MVTKLNVDESLIKDQWACAALTMNTEVSITVLIRAEVVLSSGLMAMVNAFWYFRILVCELNSALNAAEFE